MSKPKRNAPCPCGSGQKHKKCCGSSNVVQLNHQVYNDELDRLHGQLVSFAFNKYKEVLVKQNRKYELSFLTGPEKEAFMTCINIWTTLHIPVSDQNETIFDVFFKKNKTDIKHTRTKGLLAQWTNTPPSVYEVTKRTEQQLDIVDLQSKKQYQIPVEQGEFEIGDLLTGVIVPYINAYRFFVTATKLDSNQKDVILNLLSKFTQQESGLDKKYPDFLIGLLLRPSLDTMKSEVEWDKEVHKEVADLFSKHSKDKTYPEKVINLGIDLWKKYCDEENPNLKKPTVYAAALDYLVQGSIDATKAKTQKEIAEEYGTSPATVSSNYRKLSGLLEEELKQLSS